MKTRHLLLLGLAAVAGLPPSVTPVRSADPKEKSKEIIAVQLRRQGYECKKPKSAERDDAASKPDAEVWTLNCQGVSYKVKLIPNMAATVEKLPDDQQSTQQP